MEVRRSRVICFPLPHLHAPLNFPPFKLKNEICPQSHCQHTHTPRCQYVNNLKNLISTNKVLISTLLVLFIYWEPRGEKSSKHMQRLLIWKIWKSIFSICNFQKSQQQKYTHNILQNQMLPFMLHDALWHIKNIFHRILLLTKWKNDRQKLSSLLANSSDCRHDIDL